MTLKLKRKPGLEHWSVRVGIDTSDSGHHDLLLILTLDTSRTRRKLICVLTETATEMTFL